MHFLLMNVVPISLYFDVNYKLHDKLRLKHNTEWRTSGLALFIDCTVTPSNPVFQYHIPYAAVAFPGIFFGGWGSTNSVEDRGQRDRESGGDSPLVRGSGGSCNLVQEI